MNDQYVIRARVDNAIVKLDIKPATYDEALATWTALVGLVFPADGRKPRKTVLLANETWGGIANATQCRVAWFDVRSTNDPGTQGIPVVKLRVLRSGPGVLDERSAIRRWGEEHGFHSHEGGWIYRGPAKHAGVTTNVRWQTSNPSCQLTNHQGWSSFAMSGRIPRGAIVRIAFRFYRTEEI